VQAEVVTGGGHLNADMAADYGGISVRACLGAFELDGVILQVLAADGGDELSFGLGFAARMSVGEVVGQDGVEGCKIGVQGGVCPFLIKGF
jgi:hypothetical protein